MVNNYIHMNFDTTFKYVIKKGDTPYKIAKQFKITLEDLIKLNPNLNPIGLNEGDLLIIQE